jgi:hypothetical protein
MASKMLDFAGMKTELEFVDEYLDFIQSAVFHLYSEEIIRNLK